LIEVLPFETRIQPPVYHQHRPGLRRQVRLLRLRHTHASQLIAAGMDVVTISHRFGHASPTIALNVFGHLFSNTDDRAAEIMEVAFSRRRTE
jgi:integrase